MEPSSNNSKLYMTYTANGQKERASGSGESTDVRGMSSLGGSGSAGSAGAAAMAGKLIQTNSAVASSHSLQNKSVVVQPNSQQTTYKEIIIVTRATQQIIASLDKQKYPTIEKELAEIVVINEGPGLNLPEVILKKYLCMVVLALRNHDEDEIKQLMKLLCEKVEDFKGSALNQRMNDLCRFKICVKNSFSTPAQCQSIENNFFNSLQKIDLSFLNDNFEFSTDKKKEKFCGEIVSFYVKLGFEHQLQTDPQGLKCITDQKTKYYMLFALGMYYSNNQNPEKALECFIDILIFDWNVIPESPALLILKNLQLILERDVDRAIEIVQKNIKLFSPDLVGKLIREELVENLGRVDKALIMINLLRAQGEKEAEKAANYSLCYIILKFPDKCEELFDLISNDGFKLTVIFETFDTVHALESNKAKSLVIFENYLNKAFNIVLKDDSPKYCLDDKRMYGYRVFETFFKTATSREHVELLIKKIDLIEDPYLKYDCLNKIFEYYLKKEEIDFALEIFHLMPEPRSLAIVSKSRCNGEGGNKYLKYFDIVDHYLKQNNFKKAINLLRKIPLIEIDSALVSKTINEVITAVLLQGELTSLIELYNFLPTTWIGPVYVGIKSLRLFNNDRAKALTSFKGGLIPNSPKEFKEMTSFIEEETQKMVGKLK